MKLRLNILLNLKKPFMKIRNYFIAIAIISFTSGITSCKKDNNSSSSSTNTATEAKTQADDQTFFSTETDAASNDANASLEAYGGSNVQAPVGIQTPAFSIPCDATVTVDTTNDPRTITITYNGNSCNGERTRTGSVVISFAHDFRWRNANASVSITFHNLKVTRNSDGKSITINGVRTITNVSGGLIKDLATTDSIVHKIDDTNMSITFDNGAQRTWETHMTRVFTYNNGIVITTTGNVSGQNRFGDNFTCTILEPLVVEQSCDFHLVSGEVQHIGPKVTTTITFGLDSSGNPITSCTALLYFKVIWADGNGHTFTYIGLY